MKIHIGVDAGSGYVHTISGTAANVSDIAEAHHLIREEDEVVYGDSGYTGLHKREEIKSNEHFSNIDYRIAMKPSTMKMKTTSGINWDKHIEHRKSSVRCKVEHPFLIVKKGFGCARVVYRGIKKNLNRYHMAFASSNLLMCARAGRTNDYIRAIG